MGRFVTIDGAPTGPAMHVVDPGVPLDTLVVDPLDVWRTQPSVRKVVDFVASNLASIPLHVYARDAATDGRTRVRDRAAASLLAEPAPMTTPYRFWHTLHVDGMLHDRYCAVHLSADDEGPEMLFRLPPSRFRILRGTYNEPKAIVVWPKGGDEYHLDPRVAVFDSGYASAWGDVTAPIATLSEVLLESTEARRYRRELFKNGARISAVIERPAESPWDDAAWNRFRSQFATYKAGGGDAGGTPILEDGMKYKAVDSFEPQKLEVIEARKLTDAEVASFYHVPPEMVGAREGTFANLDAFRQMLWSITLGPRIVAWEQSLNLGLARFLEMPDGHYVEAHVDAKLRGSFLEQAAAYQSAVGAPIMTRNEARKQRNLPPVPGGDDIITPLNVIVGGLASPRDTAPKAATPGKARGRVKATRPDELGDRETETAAFVERVRVFWNGLADDIEAAMQDEPKAMPDLAQVLDTTAVAAALEPIVRAHMQRLAEVGAWDVLAEWNPDADGWGPEMVEAWIARAAETDAAAWARGIHNGAARAAASDDPENGLRAFLRSDALASVLAAAFALEALGFGAHDAAKKSGLGVKTWRVTSKNPRVSHAAQDGQTVRIDDIFANGLRWPGDHFGNADETAGCTCRLTYGRGDS